MNKKKVAIICPYPEGVAPSQRLKYEQYLPYLSCNGYEFEIKPFFSKSAWQILYKDGYSFKKIFFTFLGYFNRFYLLIKLRKYDFIYIHLWVTPIGFPFFEFLYSKIAKKYIYDIDDLVYLGVKSKANSKIPFLKTRYKTEHLIKNANHVISCTPFLDKYVRNFNQNTTDISSTVDSEKYFYESKMIDFKNIVLGWSGSHSTSQYLSILKKVFQRLSIKFNVTLLVIGDDKLNYTEIETTAIKWNSESEIDDLRKIDIGLYPLPFEEWVYGKSGLKAIQYMSLGIPTIATDVGTITRIINHDRNGLLIKDNNIDDWYNAIEKLILLPEFYQKISKNGAETIKNNFTVKSNQKTYLDILNNIV